MKEEDEAMKKDATEYEKTSARRIRQLIDEYCEGKQQIFAEKTGIGKSSVSQYVNETNYPNNKTCGIIAKTFGLNPMWVMGFNEDKKRSAPLRFTALPFTEEDRKTFAKQIHDSMALHELLDNDEVDMIREFRKLDDIDRQFIMSVIRHEVNRGKK